MCFFSRSLFLWLSGLFLVALAVASTVLWFYAQGLRERLMATQRGFHRDLSLDPPPTKAYVPKGRVWLVNYADGNAVYRQSVHFQVQTALNRGIDAVMMYGPRDLDDAFVRKNAAILRQKRGVGYWLWKPYILLKTLEMIPENDIIVYLDAGVAVSKHLEPYLRLLETSEAVFFSCRHENRRFVKRDCVPLMDLDESVLDEKQLSASQLLLRNTPRTRAFIQKWLTYMEDPRLSTDLPSQEPEDPIFQDHRHDQSVLSLCMLQEFRKSWEQKDKLPIALQSWGLFALGWKTDGVFFHHRRRVGTQSLYRRCPTP
jgi:hypothetical protein